MILNNNDICTKVVAINIEWDFDDEDDGSSLPKTMEIPEEVLEAYKEDEDAISDYLSEQTGFCHKGFRLAKVAEDGSMEGFEDG